MNQRTLIQDTLDIRQGRNPTHYASGFTRAYTCYPLPALQHRRM